MKFNKKQKQWLGIILGIILVGIVLNQTGLLSVWGTTYRLDCFTSVNGLTCTPYGSSSGNLAFQVITGTTHLSISQPSDYQSYNSMVIGVAEKFSGVRFYDYVCNKKPDSCTSPYSPSNPPPTVKLEQQQYFIKDTIGNSILIIEGGVLDMTGVDDTRNARDTGQTIKIYSFVDIDKREMSISDPFPNDNSKVIASTSGHPLTFEIYVKKGGYTENDLCSSFQINCQTTDDDTDDIDGDDEVIDDGDTTDDTDTDDTDDEIIDEETKTEPDTFLFWMFIVGGIVLVIGLIWLFFKMRRK